MIQSRLPCLFFILLNLIIVGCSSDELIEVSTHDFSAFVSDTKYVTDAEQFGWSIVQEDVFNFQILYGVDWLCPDGLHNALSNEPVRQVSYNDALTYANWKDARLPTYEEYWNLVNRNNGNINESSTLIFEIGKSNIIGNVWEITKPDPYGRIRLAGGSYLCNPNTCNGTSPNRELYVDQITGNSHIGFAVIR